MSKNRKKSLKEICDAINEINEEVKEENKRELISLIVITLMLGVFVTAMFSLSIKLF